MANKSKKKETRQESFSSDWHKKIEELKARMKRIEIKLGIESGK